MHTTPSEETTGRRLPGVLGVTFGVAITIGNTAGIGILRSPSAIAAEIPSVWGYLAIWVAAGVYALLVALAYAQLALRSGRSGGPYTWLKDSFGTTTGFVVGWIDWVAMCGVLAVAAAVFGEYAVGLAPEFRAPEVIALIVIVFVTLVQSAGIRVAAWFQYGSVVLKLVALVVFIAACIYFGTRTVDGGALHAEPDGSLLTAIVLALVAVIVTVHGAGAATYFAGELRDGASMLRKSVLIGVVAIVTLYVAVNVAILLVVPLPTIAGKGVALDVVSDRLFGEGGAMLARSLVVLALLSAVNAAALIASRILHAMGEDGTFIGAAAEVNRRGTPELALLFTSAVAGALVVTNSHEWLMPCVAVVFTIAAAASFVALLRSGSIATGTKLAAIAGLSASAVILIGIAGTDPLAFVRTGAVAAAGLLIHLGVRK